MGPPQMNMPPMGMPPQMPPMGMPPQMPPMGMPPQMPPMAGMHSNNRDRSERDDRGKASSILHNFFTSCIYNECILQEAAVIIVSTNIVDEGIRIAITIAAEIEIEAIESQRYDICNI